MKGEMRIILISVLGERQRMKRGGSLLLSFLNLRLYCQVWAF